MSINKKLLKMFFILPLLVAGTDNISAMDEDELQPDKQGSFEFTIHQEPQEDLEGLEAAFFINEIQGMSASDIACRLMHDGREIEKLRSINNHLNEKIKWLECILDIQTSWSDQPKIGPNPTPPSSPRDPYIGEVNRYKVNLPLLEQGGQCERIKN